LTNSTSYAIIINGQNFSLITEEKMKYFPTVKLRFDEEEVTFTGRLACMVLEIYRHREIILSADKGNIRLDFAGDSVACKITLQPTS